MLLREDLGRGEQRSLAAGIDHLQHGPDRNDRLARADLALQQPVHRVIKLELVRDRRAGQLLADGQLERQRRVERLQQAPVPAAPRCR